MSETTREVLDSYQKYLAAIVIKIWKRLWQQ